MFLEIIGWFLLGAAVVGAVAAFWDQIRDWLNNTAANAVEKVLGYNARQKMHRAIAKIDRVMDKVRNRSVVFTKRDQLDTTYDKVTLYSEASCYEISNDVLNEIAQKGELVQEFGYKG